MRLAELWDEYLTARGGDDPQVGPFYAGPSPLEVTASALAEAARAHTEASLHSYRAGIIMTGRINDPTKWRPLFGGIA